MPTIKLIKVNNEIRVLSTPDRIKKYEFNLAEKIDQARSPQKDGTDVPNPSPPLLDIGAKVETPDGDGISVGYGKLQREDYRFSLRAKRTLRHAASTLDAEDLSGEMIFLTGTLPGSTQESFNAIARYSSYIVHRLKAWVNKRVPSKYDFYVWEWQKRGALHLHYVFHCDSKVIGDWIISEFKTEWNRLLEKVCEMSNVDLYEKTKEFSWRDNKSQVQVDARWCNSLVAKYLGKYLGKSKSSLKGFQHKKLFVPARWYGVSRPLLALIRRNTVVIEYPGLTRGSAEALFEHYIWYLQATAECAYTYGHKVSGGRSLVAYTQTSLTEDIWIQMKSLMTRKEMNMSSALTLSDLLRQGIALCRNNSSWKTLFKTSCGTYATALALRFIRRESLSPLDEAMLMDALSWSFSQLQRTQGCSDPDCNLWAIAARRYLLEGEPEDSPIYQAIAGGSPEV